MFLWQIANFSPMQNLISTVFWMLTELLIRTLNFYHLETLSHHPFFFFNIFFDSFSFHSSLPTLFLSFFLSSHLLASFFLPPQPPSISPRFYRFSLFSHPHPVDEPRRSGSKGDDSSYRAVKPPPTRRQNSRWRVTQQWRRDLLYFAFEVSSIPFYLLDSRSNPSAVSTGARRDRLKWNRGPWTSRDAKRDGSRWGWRWTAKNEEEGGLGETRDTLRRETERERESVALGNSNLHLFYYIIIPTRRSISGALKRRFSNRFTWNTASGDFQCRWPEKVGS